LLRRNDKHGWDRLQPGIQSTPGAVDALVAVAGQRWRVEESFQTSKGLTGPHQHQVRRWTSWHRWTTLAVLAHAFLTATATVERESQPTPHGLIPLTVNELRRLFDALLLRPKRTIQRILDWSNWRRQHQARARASNYRTWANHNDHKLVLQY
jgi:hypothetical protein